MSLLKLQRTPVPARRRRLLECLLFAAVLWGCGAFYSGGGWNQNARFAQVRAMVEERRFTIDDFLIYTVPNAGTGLEAKGVSAGAGGASPQVSTGAKRSGPQMRRLPLENGNVRLETGEVVRTGWVDENGAVSPIVGGTKEGAAAAGEIDPHPLIALQKLAASGDVTFSHGHFYPNKPPGASLLAVPAYAVLFGMEQLAGLNPDAFRVLTVNAWLCTVFVAGVASAFGAVLLFRVACRFANCSQALAVALAYAFGTMALPYGTVLFDQNITACLLLACFACVLNAREAAGMDGVFTGARKTQEIRQAEIAKEAALAQTTPRGHANALHWALLAGLCGGGAVLCNYIAAAALTLLTLYAGRRFWLPICLGAAGPLAALLAYHAVCFGSPLILSTSGQNPMFANQHHGHLFLGMFGMPDFRVALLLLFSPFRGLFFYSPVLLLAVRGWWLGWRSGSRREVLVCAAVFAVFLAVNVTFSGWHGGYGTAPRYLGPALPFLALGLAWSWPQMPRFSTALAAASALIQLALTATDPLSPVGTGSVAWVEGHPDWTFCALTQYAVPLLATGRAWPMLDLLAEHRLGQEDARLAEAGMAPAKRREELDRLRQSMNLAAAQGNPDPFPLAAFAGPVSVSPMGICEGDFFQLFKPNSREARWNAFNLGEFLFPESLWSLLPIVAVALGLAGWAMVVAKSIGNKSADGIAQKPEA